MDTHQTNGKSVIDDVIKQSTHLIHGQAVQASQENATRMILDANNILEAKIVTQVQSV